MLFYLTEDNMKITKELAEYKSIEFIDYNHSLYKEL